MEVRKNSWKFARMVEVRKNGGSSQEWRKTKNNWVLAISEMEISDKGSSGKESDLQLVPERAALVILSFKNTTFHVSLDRELA
jgi:hypothetical protein